MKIALFIPCYIDQFYPQVGIASFQLLEKLGCVVHFPTNQTCCGQPMANSGYEHFSTKCTQNFVDVFADFEYIVSPSGSCVLHLKHSTKKQNIFELTEFLTDILKVENLEANFPFRVGLHQSCHGQRGLGLAQMSEINAPHFSKPVRLLNQVKDLKLINLNRSDECCGFGGTFCVSEEAISVKMGKDRVADHQANGVEYITGTDTSCLMHLEGILKRQNSTLKIIHIAEILNGFIA